MTVLHENLEQSQDLNSVHMDRFSRLPDDLLIKILKFLPTKYAFVASVLSRRWRYLFKEVNHLDFDDSHLFNSRSALHHDKSCGAFTAFICKMLDCFKLSDLMRFRIKSVASCQMCFQRRIQPWLDALFSHKIQEIDLGVNLCIVFPHSIFTCTTLCVIKLNTFADIEIPDTLCLPCLKILHVKRIRVFGADPVSRILSGCPLLHDFCIEPFSWDRADQLSISGPSLTNLKLIKSDGICRWPPRSHFSIVAPRLQCFHYADELAKSYSIKTSNHLVAAHLYIFLDKRVFEDLLAISHSACDLLQGVSNVQRLFLSADCIEALTCVKVELPILCNVTKLELGCCINWHVTLLRLLETAPHLEELIFSEGLFPVNNFKDKDIACEDNWGRHQVVPSCLKTRLKVIRIEHLLGLKEELRMVEYFLSRCDILSQLIIHIHNWLGRKAKFKVRKQLKRMAKRWGKCVLFSDLYLP